MPDSAHSTVPARASVTLPRNVTKLRIRKTCLGHELQLPSKLPGTP
jgi:hypothetical protein